MGPWASIEARAAASGTRQGAIGERREQRQEEQRARLRGERRSERGMSASGVPSMSAAFLIFLFFKIVSPLVLDLTVMPLLIIDLNLTHPKTGGDTHFEPAVMGRWSSV